MYNKTYLTSSVVVCAVHITTSSILGNGLNISQYTDSTVFSILPIQININFKNYFVALYTELLIHKPAVGDLYHNKI